jgi:hypothetical protein
MQERARAGNEQCGSIVFHQPRFTVSRPPLCYLTIL